MHYKAAKMRLIGMPFTRRIPLQRKKTQGKYFNIFNAFPLRQVAIIQVLLSDSNIIFKDDII
jgi:hypothetical protein